MARKSSDVASVIASHIFLARVHQFRGDPERVREVAEAARALAREHGFAQRLAAATILWGWALAARGQTAEGIAAIIEGIAAFRATGAVDDVPYWLALLAEARGIGGRVEDALRDIDEALELVEAGGVRIWEAELHRVRGELLRRPLPDSPGAAARATRAEVERCFLEALAVARSQQAKALELRAATSLARLRLGQDDRGDARRILSDVYGWFSEGFDTPDLTEARRLLTEMEVIDSARRPRPNG